MFVCCGQRCRSFVLNESRRNSTTASDNGSMSQSTITTTTNTGIQEVAAASAHSAAQIFQCTTSRSANDEIASDHQQRQQTHSSSTLVARSTPILYATNRGLHLRLAQPSRTSSVQSGRSGMAYEMKFCDLERWSTNRANTVSLEDTFTVHKHHHRASSMAGSASYQSVLSHLRESQR